MKKCRVCGREKPLTEFHKREAGHYRSDCKDCRNAAERARYHRPLNWLKISFARERQRQTKGHRAYMRDYMKHYRETHERTDENTRQRRLTGAYERLLK